MVPSLRKLAHGESRESRVVGRRIEDIQLPRGATISAIVRGDEVLMAHHDTKIQADDHVILFIADRRQIDEVERLFEVGGALI
jgi:trk system potassium uptake protein TrkA